MPALFTCFCISPGSAIPPDTLGVEVTDSAFAAACDLGNIDPQHGFARGPVTQGRAAIDAALSWPLPPGGAALATIRPDVDSIGAMAVLSLRAAGVAFTPAMHARVDLVARSDCFDYGYWASWAAAHPPPVKEDLLLALSLHPLEFRALAAFIGKYTNKLRGDELPTSVAMMCDWLMTGALPPEGEAAVRTSDAQAAAAWAAGRLPVTLACQGTVAIVLSQYPGAMALGYRHAPIVIAERRLDGKRKISVAQFARGHVDMAALDARLNSIEPGWGGSATILGSPQGQSSEVKIDDIVDLIEKTGARV
jgi:hypothetical protein